MFVYSNYVLDVKRTENHFTAEGRQLMIKKAQIVINL